MENILPQITKPFISMTRKCHLCVQDKVENGWVRRREVGVLGTGTGKLPCEGSWLTWKGSRCVQKPLTGVSCH